MYGRLSSLDKTSNGDKAVRPVLNRTQARESTYPTAKWQRVADRSQFYRLDAVSGIGNL